MTDSGPNARLTPHDDQFRRDRQRARNRVLGLILGSLAVLFFAITIVKLGLQGDAG